MKKLILIALCFGLMAFGSAGSAGAYTQDLLIGHLMNPGETYYIHFDTPSDFEVPPDKVISSWVGISGITDGGNKVVIEGNLVGNLGSSTPWWHFNSANFDVKNVFATFWPNSKEFVVSVEAASKFVLGASEFNLEYENGSLPGPGNGTTAPVPEPATLLLLGSCLSGMAFWGKRRKVAE